MRYIFGVFVCCLLEAVCAGSLIGKAIKSPETGTIILASIPIALFVLAAIAFGVMLSKEAGRKV